MQSQAVVGPFPKGSAAWFVCRSKGLVSDIMVPLRDGAAATEAEFARRGRIKAARRFKAEHGLHPCTKVECEFQLIETPEKSNGR